METQEGNNGMELDAISAGLSNIGSALRPGKDPGFNPSKVGRGSPRLDVNRMR